MRPATSAPRSRESDRGDRTRGGSQRRWQARHAVVLISLLLAGCGSESSIYIFTPTTPTPAAVPTATRPAATATAPTAPTRTATTAPSATRTPRASATMASATQTATATMTAPHTATAQPTRTITATASPSASATAVESTATATATLSPTAMPSATATWSPTVSPSPTLTPTMAGSETPTFTPTPTGMPTETPTAGSGAVCGNRVLESGETCTSCPADCVTGPCANPGPPTQAFIVDLVPPLGFEPTTATVQIGYDSTRLSLPGSATATSVRQRVVAPPPIPQAFTPNDLDYAVRVLISRNVPLSRLFTVTFDRCGGAAAPTLGDLACTVESCAAGGTGVPGCTCTVSLP